jgi:phosphoribosylglycinamide formyltransferase-1
MQHKIAIFASGHGSNAENIIKTFRDNNGPIVSLLVSNKPDAYVLTRGHQLGIESLFISNKDFRESPQKIITELRRRAIDIIVLAGFMIKVHDDIVKAYRNQILNIHPSLLPAYGGKGMWGHHVHEAVIAAGEKVSGATVHLVSEHIDGGDIIMQKRVDVTADDTPKSLEAKIHEVEYDLYPKAIMHFIESYN